MVNIEDLKEFLQKANMPHAKGTADMRKQKNGSRTIYFSDGDWSMEDNFFGGEPYGGEQVIFYKGEPAWMCVYYGRVVTDDDNADEVYNFLREALQHPSEDMPVRGPESYKKESLEYKHKLRGELDNFSSEEVILNNGKQIYWAKFIGGFVDQRFKGSV